MPLQLDIITPEKTLFSQAVEHVILPGGDGEMDILPDHAAIISTLEAGELSYILEGKTIHIAVGQGFIEAGPGEVKVLTDMVATSDEINEAHEEEAITRAEEALKKAESLTEEQRAVTQAALSNAIARLALKKKNWKG